MKVLVTGATGFTGGHLAQHLASRGEEVRALVRPRSRARFDQSPLPAKGVAAIEGDLTDAASMRRAAEGVDVVYHIAATYREAGQPDSAYRAINVMGEAPVSVTATPVWASSGVDISMMATLEFANHRYAQMSCAMNVANHRRAVIMGTDGTIETEYINHPSDAVPSQLRIRRGIANTIPFEDVAAAVGSGFRYEAEAFADMIRRNDAAAFEAAAQFSIDIATTLEAIGDCVNVRTTMLDEVPAEPPFMETFTSEALPWATTGARRSYPGFPEMDEYPRLMQEFAARASS